MAKTTKKGRQFVSGEISKLMKKGPSKRPLKGRKFKQKQAVAAALNVARKKGYKVPPAPQDESRSIFDDLIAEASSPKSIFDELLVAETDEPDLDPDRYARALALSETLVNIKQKVLGQ